MSTRAANRYAKALIELASQSKQEDAVHSDMLSISQSINGSKELQQVLESPILENKTKKLVIDAVFEKNNSLLTQKLFNLLSENKRLNLLQKVAFQYNILYNNQKGIVHAIVTSAISLDENLKNKVLEKAKEIVGSDKKIIIENRINPEIIGGFIIRVGDVQVDTSISNQLSKLKRELLEN